MKPLFAFVAFLLPQLAAAALVYTPPGFRSESARVVMVIHGCLQSGEAMALGAGWNRLADQQNLAVIYPQAPAGSNPFDCWNWFLPENQRRDSGHLHALMRDLRLTLKTLKLAKAPVFVTGISSGAATAAGLLACFPEAFTAGALHSGPSYGLASNPSEAQRVLQEGPGERSATAPCKPGDFRGGIMALQGSADVVVNPAHAARVVTDFSGGTPGEAVTNEANGLTYTVTDYAPAKSRGRGRLVMVKDLPHAWSGAGLKGKNPLPFFHEQGPSSTKLIWEFFSGI